MNDSHRLKAIFLDIDDTLFSTTVFAEKARGNAVRAMIESGLKVSFEEAFRELKEVITEFSSNHGHHFDKLLKRFPPDAVGCVNPAVLVASGVIAYHRTKNSELKPFPDVLAALEILGETPLLIGIITAGLAVKQAEKLLRLGLYKHIDPRALFISDQIGISKPNKKLFLKACASSGLNPGSAMYVGNDPVNDIDPANSAGMVTVRVLRETRLPRRKGKTKPDYTILGFQELLALLKRDFAVDALP